MSIDTRDKRMSLMGFGLPVPRVLPHPDGAVDTQDRAMHLYLYAGIALGSAAVSGLRAVFKAMGRGLFRGMG